MEELSLTFEQAKSRSGDEPPIPLESFDLKDLKKGEVLFLFSHFSGRTYKGQEMTFLRETNEGYLVKIGDKEGRIPKGKIDVYSSGSEMGLILYINDQPIVVPFKRMLKLQAQAA